MILLFTILFYINSEARTPSVDSQMISVEAEGVDVKIIAPPVIPAAKMLFPLSDVRLLDSQFKDIQDLTHTYLLSLEPDRLLSWFRREAGLTSKAPAYPFWESEDVWGSGPLAGHILGFYLSAMSMMYEAIGDENIRQKISYLVDEMKTCQEAQKDGYLLATINGRHVFEDVVKGDFKTNNPTINGVWEPVYIMNKIMLGLYNAYLTFDMPVAKEVLIKMADWFGNDVLNKLTYEQIQKLLVCEHGSINESLVDVYAITGDKKYLEWAKLLNDEDMLIPAAESRDVLNGWHANTQIPKFTGFERVYTYTKEKKYRQAASFFWETVVDKHTWVIGGNSTGEHFFPVKEFEKRVTNLGGAESCNSVNMMRLTEALYGTEGDMNKVDYYERVLFNHILANYDPHEGMCTYYTSMRPGHYRVYGTKYHSFWCCTGTGMEAPARFGKMIYAHHNLDLYVNLFIASELNWREKGVTLLQYTDFPNKNEVKLVVKSADNTHFTLNIRHPYWMTSQKMTVSINGQKKTITANSKGYIQLNRTWNTGDKVVVTLTPQITVEYLKASDKYAAFLYGPMVLAAKVDNNDLKKEDDFHLARRMVASEEIPVLKAYALIGKLDQVPENVHRKDTEGLAFECSSKVASAQFELVPFNRIHFDRYEIYFPVFGTREEYDIAFAKVENEIWERDLIERTTVDRVRFYSENSRIKHKQDGVNLRNGDTHGQPWIHAENGGYCMYQMSVLPHVKQSVCLKFVKTDAGKRVFDVLVDGHVIATLDHSRPRDISRLFYYETISIPEELIGSKEYITVKLQAQKGNIAGGFFDLRVLKDE